VLVHPLGDVEDVFVQDDEFLAVFDSFSEFCVAYYVLEIYLLLLCG